MKRIIPLFFLILIFACADNREEQAEEIITRFEKENITDKREVVFAVEAQLSSGELILQGETSEKQLKTALLKKLEGINFIDSITILPDSTVGETTFGLIALSVSNHRAAPGHSSELVTQSLMGTPVKILKKNNNWYFVQTPDNYLSWVDAGGIEPITPGDLQKWQNVQRLVFNAASGTVYKTEKMSEPLSDIVLGNVVELQNKTPNLLKVKLPDGRTGFTAATNWMDFQTFKNQEKIDIPLIISLAKTLTGRPYLWGGTSSNAMDCSGFTKTVYFMNGVILARDASLQVRQGKPVEPGPGFSNLQPGDLLFFGKKAQNGQPEKVTHVGISLGGTEFIHASGRVQYNSFHPDSSNFSEYRKKSFIGARRISGSEENNGIQRVLQHPWYE